MKPKVYIETSVVSYLTSKLSRDLLVAGHQQVTQDWWERRRGDFELFTSEVVTSEAGEGDAEAAGRRLRALSGLTQLQVSQAAQALAVALVAQGVVPPGKPEDALHIALAAAHGMDYLLTWNCAHIANAEMRKAVEDVCASLGYRAPIICTPEELLGE